MSVKSLTSVTLAACVGLLLPLSAAFAQIDSAPPAVEALIRGDQTLRYGQSSATVRELQTLLKEEGFLTGRVDGVYGPATEAAMLAYRGALAAEGRLGGPSDAEEEDYAEEDEALAAMPEPEPLVPSETVAPEPIAPAPPPPPAPSPATSGDAYARDTSASTGDDAAAPSDEDDDGVEPPMLAPFSGPASGRPLPPPASLAGGDLEASIEGASTQLFREATVETASKRAQALQDVPMTISWIPAEELEGTGYFTLCDAIQYFPGMECRRGAMRKAAVSARGLSSNFLSNRLLLLQDGRPQTDPWTGQFYADETMPLTNIKQIEVIRGPGSSLYGSNAFSGVINIIRREPGDLIEEGRDWGLDARALVGQYNTYRFQTTAAGRVDELEGLVNYYGYYSDGPQLLNDPEAGIVDTQEWSEVHQVSSIVGYGPFRFDIDFTNADIGRPGGKQISEVGNCGRCHYTPNDEEQVQNLNANLQADFRLTENLRVFGQAYTLFKRRVVQLENQITGEMEAALGKRNRTGGEVRALLSVGDTFHVTLGGDVKHDLVNNRNVIAGLNSRVDPETGETILDTQQTIYGAYVDAELRPLPDLVIGGGVRFDHYEIPEAVWGNPEAQLSPRASVVYHLVPNHLTLRTNYGRAFRAPTLAELAINQQMYASTLVGNPLLLAETLDTIEAAVDFWPFEDGSARFTATGFYNLAKNFINQEYLVGSTSRFENVGDAQVAGFEVEAAARVKEINSSFDVAYQFLRALEIPNEGAIGFLDYAPQHRVYFRGRTNVNKWIFAELYGVFVGSRFDPAHVEVDGVLQRAHLTGYLSANARVGANVFPGLSVSLIGTNVFDTSYEEMYGFPMPGASIFTEVKFTY